MDLDQLISLKNNEIASIVEEKLKTAIEKNTSDFKEELQTLLNAIKTKLGLTAFKLEHEETENEEIEQLTEIKEMIQKILDTLAKTNNILMTLKENYGKIIVLFPQLRSSEPFIFLRRLQINPLKDILQTQNFNVAYNLAKQYFQPLSLAMDNNWIDPINLYEQLLLRKKLIDLTLPLRMHLIKIPAKILFNLLWKLDKEAGIKENEYERYSLQPPLESIFGDIGNYKVASIVNVQGKILNKEAVINLLKNAKDKLSNIWQHLLHPKAINLIDRDWPEAFLATPLSFRKEVAHLL